MQLAPRIHLVIRNGYKSPPTSIPHPVPAAASSATAAGATTRAKRLDSPGIIPSNMLDQNDALLLEACKSVGVGAYNNQAVAAYLCDQIQSLVMMGNDSTID